MTIAINDIVRIALTGSGPLNATWQNVWHYKMTVGAGIAEADLLTAVGVNYTQAWTAVSAYLSDQYSADLIEGWKYNFSTHKWNGFGSDTLSGLVGGSAGDPVPHGVAAVGRYVVTVARRQGRTFLPGALETTCDAGAWDSAFLTAFGNYMDEFTDDLTPTGGTVELCTFNTDELSVYYETASVFYNTIILSPVPGYQRRRKPGVGL